MNLIYLSLILVSQTQFQYPDPHLTPGVALPNVTAAQVCVPGYSSGVRNVSTQTKNEVKMAYKKAYPNWPDCSQSGACEIDHFISLELGGSNDVGNLWPEPYTGALNAHEKDKVEDYLHEQVCLGKMSLAEAQREITKDWVDVYDQISANKKN